MQVMVILMLMASAAAEPAEPGGMSDTQQERLLQALIKMGEAPMTQESEILRAHVMQEGVNPSARISLFETFFSDYPFTAHHHTNLQAHLLYGSAEHASMARFSGAFAATAVRFFWAQVNAETGRTPQPSHALPFLESLYNNSSEEIRKATASGINDALHNNKLFLRPYLAGDAPVTLEMQVEAMQTCVTLGAFARDHNITDWLIVPEQTGNLADTSGVWLFDGGALHEENVRSIESVFSSVPDTLHGVVVLFTPEAMPFSAETAPIRLPGLALNIPLLPMDMLRDISYMPPYLSTPLVPEFTLAVLEQLMYAIQSNARRNRPDWFYRRDVMLRRAGAMPISPLDSMAPPEIVRGAPDAFIAYTGALWMINAEALLEGAIQLVESQRVREPLYALFLIADLLSSGSETTLLFRTSPAGTLNRREAAVRRIFLSPTTSYVNGIAVGGQLWQYDLSDLI